MMSNRWKVIVAAVLVTAAGICYVRGTDRGGSVEDGLLLPVLESGAEAGDENVSHDAEAPDDVEETAEGEGALEDKSVHAQESVAPLAETKIPSGRDGQVRPEAEESGIWIHVCGEVRVPGVYELAAGSRVYQAVEAAGGFTEAAERDYLNMAQTLEDGMKLVIPDLETAKRLREKQNSGQQNSGSAEQGAEAVEAGIFPAAKPPGSSMAQGAGARESSAKVNINTASKEELMTLKGVGGSRADDIIAYRETHGPFQKIEDIMKVSGIKEASFEKIKEDITV